MSKLGKRVAGAWEFLYWDVYYTTGFSLIAGVGNGVSTRATGGDFHCGLGEAIQNHYPFGLGANLLYPSAHNAAMHSQNYRAWAHVANLAINGAFLAWHYYSGTEHPLVAMTPNFAIGAVMTEYNVRRNRSRSGADTHI